MDKFWNILPRPSFSSHCSNPWTPDVSGRADSRRTCLTRRFQRNTRQNEKLEEKTEEYFEEAQIVSIHAS